MTCRLLVLAALCAVTAAYPRGVPDKPVFDNGFKPVEGSRGSAPSRRSNQQSDNKKRISPRSPNLGFGGHGASSSFASGLVDSLQFGDAGGIHGGGGSIHGGGGGFSGASFSGGFSGGHGGGDANLGEPDKTIYVRLPQEEVNHPPPKAAGPPQKHYRIVIIRSPSPAPVQPIIPPRTEQKTIIYVLHQKPKVQQEIVETPVVRHPPQVLFVGYDDDLSAQDLKQLAEGNHEGFTVSTQQDQIDGGGYSGNQIVGGNFGASPITSLPNFQSGGSSFHNRGGSGIPGFSYQNRRSSSDSS